MIRRLWAFLWLMGLAACAAVPAPSPYPDKGGEQLGSAEPPLPFAPDDLSQMSANAIQQWFIPPLLKRREGGLELITYRSPTCAATLISRDPAAKVEFFRLAQLRVEQDDLPAAFQASCVRSLLRR